VHGRDHAVGQDAARARRQQPRDVGFREPAEDDALPGTRELRQHPGARSLAHLDVAVRAENEQACVGELGGNEAQQEQRCRIGPVEIVEHHEQWAVGTELPQRACDRLEELEARVGRLRFGRHHRPWHVVGEQGCERVCRGTGAMLRLPLLVGPEHLDPRPVRRCTLRLLAPAPAYRHAERGGAERELARDAGLTDARLAHEEHEPSVVSDGPIERMHEATELDLTADEQIAHPGRHRQARNDPCMFGASGADVAHLITPSPALVHYPTTPARSASPEPRCASLSPSDGMPARCVCVRFLLVLSARQ